MDYFTIGQTFLTPSFDLDVKEERKLLRYLNFPDRSGVVEVIRKHVKNNTSDGCRPNCNYYRLFATILYGFAFDGCTMRQLETKCRYGLRFICPMHRQRVDYSTFARFIKNVITPNEHEIFAILCRQIVKELDIKLEDAFVDGTKLEANANKFKFVWKSMPDSYTLCEDGTITCPNSSKGMVATIEKSIRKRRIPCSMSSKDALNVPLPTVAKGSPETKTGTSKSSKSTGTCRGTDSRRRTICFLSKGLKSESTDPFGSKALQDHGRERLGS